MTIGELIDSDRYMVTGDDGTAECVGSRREARERVADLGEQGVSAYVSDLEPELAVI